MTQLNINQVNHVSHALNLPDFGRHANEQTDIRIEGHGVSIRLPFLPTLQRLLFQSKENTSFFRDRVKTGKRLGLEVNDFDSPLAIFNFLLPSYLLTLHSASVVDGDVELTDFDTVLKATVDEPVFSLTYWTSKYQQNFSRLMVRIQMNGNQCHLQLVSAVDGRVLASSLIQSELTENITEDIAF